MKATLVILILGTAACLPNAVAQEGADRGQTPPPGRGGRPPTPPVESALDANGDGTIAADEIANASAALKTLDTNGDGKLTSDEYRPAISRDGDQRHGPPGGGDRKRPMPPLDAALDANDDNIIDAAEIANAPAALGKVDKNGDGVLTADEYRPAMSPRGGGSGGAPGFGGDRQALPVGDQSNP